VGAATAPLSFYGFLNKPLFTAESAEIAEKI
jgi:hypothetical protein